MSIKQRLNNIERKMTISKGYAYCTLPAHDLTKDPPVYSDLISGEIIDEAEVIKLKEKFKESNQNKIPIYVQIQIDNTPIKDSDE